MAAVSVSVAMMRMRPPHAVQREMSMSKLGRGVRLMKGDAGAPEGCRQRPAGWWAHRLAAHPARSVGDPWRWGPGRHATQPPNLNKEGAGCRQPTPSPSRALRLHCIRELDYILVEKKR